MELPPTLKSDYRIIHRFAPGVVKCENIYSKKLYVIKRLSIKTFTSPHYLESRILRKLNEESFSPNLVMTCIETEEEYEGYYSVLEYVSGMNLLDFLSLPIVCPYRVKLVLFQKLLQIVDSIHKMGIWHRDLKLDNVIVTPKGEIVLIDWEFATFKNLNEYNAPGTLLYAPCELFGNHPVVGSFNDVWSLGVIFYAMMSYEFPFYSSTNDCEYDRQSVAEQIQNGDPSYNNGYFNAKDYGFIQRCFLPYDVRPTCSELLKHRVFRQLGEL